LHVAVCLVAYRNIDDVQACLEALARSMHADFGVVICENGGEAALDALRAALPERLAGGQEITCIWADNPGYAGGVNRCIEAARDADAWWVLNPDTQPEPQAMAALVERLQRGDVEAAGGVLYGENRVVQGFAGGWSNWLARPEMIGRGAALNAPVDPERIERRTAYLVGASMLIGRAFVDKVGLMQDDYFLYCEEVEWGVRARQLGLKLGFAPDARVLHHQGTTTGAGGTRFRELPRLPVYLQERNKMLVVRDRAPLKLPAAALATLAIILRRYALSRAWRQLGWALAGLWDGLLNRRGRPVWSR
jgi:N-acetylglucosaminyl-diphospho-decaprenol L-rhamnosyltransferase